MLYGVNREKRKKQAMEEFDKTFDILYDVYEEKTKRLIGIIFLSSILGGMLGGALITGLYILVR